ncbi:DNA topoisomerase IB [Roseococcus sp. DSY-14]|uniref:DNA topoisomerase IB n=1 Tax=Roseococcus sp. DSY-14 TaxID=3369650 RepID=UPI00387B5D26
MPLDAAAEAREAGLRHTHDGMAGLTRRRAGRGFAYRDAEGRPVRDRTTLARIRALAIPPAYTEVWICADPRGHLQATGRDARGRKQFRYHPGWRAHRDAQKYGRMAEFAAALPRIRARVAAALARPGLDRDKVLATVVRLLETTLIRVGNEEYAKENGSFGLTTLRVRHVAVEGGTLRFRFRGKSGQQWALKVSDRRVARVVRALQDLPGQELFAAPDDAGEARPVTSQEVNDWLRAAAGMDCTAKDFRTFAGTVLAGVALARCGPCATQAEAKRAVKAAIAEVARRLGNTPAVCRQCYVHPGVLDAFAAGTWALAEVAAEGLDAEEAAVVAALSAANSAARPETLPPPSPAACARRNTARTAAAAGRSGAPASR